MPRRIRIVSALLLACAACQADAPRRHAAFPRAPSAAASDSPAAAGDAGEAYREPPVHPAAYLVWWTARDDPPRSAWLDASGGVVASRPGVYVAAGARLWRWTDGERRVKGLDCRAIRKAHDRGGDPSVPTLTRTTNTSAMVEMASGRRVQIFAAGDDDGEAPPRVKTWPLAGFGPYLVIATRGRWDACGAHDLPGEYTAVLDLLRDTTIAVDDRRVMLRDSAAADAAMHETANEWERNDEHRGPGSINGWEAQWRPDGTLQAGYRFGLSACFWCGDHGEAYYRSVLVPDSVLPGWAAPWARAPGPVGRYWQSPEMRRGWRTVHAWARDTAAEDHRFWYLEPGVRTGWSAVDSANAPRLLALFRTK